MKLIVMLRMVLYLAVLAILLQFVSEVFRPKDHAKRRIDGFNAEQRGSLDVICVGSSHAFCTWNPAHLYKRHGIRSCVYGSESQPIEASLAFVKRALRVHRPKFIFLESFMLSAASGIGRAKNAPAHRAVDSYPWGFDRISLIESLVPAGKKEEMYLDMRVYHSRWRNLAKDDFVLFPQRDCLHGCQLIGKTVPIRKYLHDCDRIWDRGINAYLAIRLKQIARLAKECGAKLVVFTAPFNATVENARFCKGLARFLATQGVDYVNLIDARCGLQLDVGSDFADNKDGHLNVRGMEKVMDHVGALLKEHYRLATDARHEETWREDVARYEVAKSEEMNKWPSKGMHVKTEKR